MRAATFRRGSYGLAIVVWISAAAIHAGGEIHWTYTGDTGPEHWGELSESFTTCRDGVNQSPIDIVDPLEADLSPIEIHQSGTSRAVLNNGHTLQVDVGPGSWISVDGSKFELVQFHLHSPSEHRINGESFPLEVHFVHTNRAGERVALGVLFREGAANPSLGAIEAAAPAESGASAPLELTLDALGIVPDKQSYYRYNGSLTTPPCTEGVRWFVLQSTRTVSAEQVSTFLAMIGEDARGPQPLNARLVLR